MIAISTVLIIVLLLVGFATIWGAMILGPIILGELFNFDFRIRKREINLPPSKDDGATKMKRKTTSVRKAS